MTLKTILAILPVLSLSMSAWAGGVSSGTWPVLPAAKAKPAVVTQVEVKRIHGCGIQVCPDRTSISFQVEHGGACHTYSVTAHPSHDKVMLTIMDELTFACMAPELMNYEVTLEIENDLIPQDAKFLLANPQYVQEIMPP